MKDPSNGTVIATYQAAPKVEVIDTTGWNPFICDKEYLLYRVMLFTN